MELEMFTARILMADPKDVHAIVQEIWLDGRNSMAYDQQPPVTPQPVPGVYSIEQGRELNLNK